LSRMVPLFVAVDGMKVMVFGGGNVALRKCRYLDGARITVVAEKVLPEVAALAAEVVEARIPDDVRPMIGACDMVMAATDDRALNDRIRDDAISAGIRVNSAHGGGTVLIPSVLRREKYSVAVSSEGRVPAFPPFMVSELDGFLGPEYDRMLDLLVDLRGVAKERVPEQRRRREFLEAVLSDPAVREAVGGDRMEEAKAAALKLVG
jgi:precorrin-2 dehydrogenase/sirohydrochlorin ferrochelatase